MFSRLRIKLAGWLIGLLVAAAVLEPASARAENVIFRNETNLALVVQVTVVHNGRLHRHRPIQIGARASSPVLQIPGDKVIAIYDARIPTRALFNGTAAASATEQILVIGYDRMPPKVTLQRVDRTGQPVP